jgi:uncharacterized protein YjiS (DUF1127 family)
MLKVGFAARLRRASAVLDLWHERRRGRAVLARLSPYGLKDIGVSPGGALFEASKPFWRP